MNTRTRAAALAAAVTLLVPATALGGTAPDEPFVPFVTDFPRPAAAPPAAPRTEAGTDWDALAVQGGVGATLAALLAGTGLVLVRRRNAGPRLNDC